MASQINADYPAATNAYTVNVRQNFAYAKSEIEALQGTVGDFPVANINLDGGTDIGADLADADLILVDDGAGGTNRKSALSRVWTYILGKLTTASPQVSTLELGDASDTTLARSAAGVVTIEGVPVVTTSATQTLSNKTIAAAVLSGTLNGGGYEIGRHLSRVVAVTNSTGVTLTSADHAGCIIVTNDTGTITIPTTAGFSCVIVAGGAHTVEFNSTASAAMAAGDLMTLFVESSTVIHAVLTASANKVTFSA